MTFDISDEIANDFIRLVSNHQQRSQLITTLLQQALVAKKKAIIKACHDANQDEATNKSIDDWQRFD